MTQPINQAELAVPCSNIDTPKWVDEETARIGGTDISGKLKYRIIWGGSRVTLAPDGISLIRPYRVDMWHLEKLHQGEYEHCWRFGECPVGPQGHRKTLQDRWCRVCFMDGGIRLKIEDAVAVARGVIHLLIKTEEMQKRAIATGQFNAEQRDALLGREAVKGVAKDTAIKEATADAAPVTVKRSFQTPLRISAQQALGNTKGLKQLNAREIARGIRRRKSA